MPRMSKKLKHEWSLFLNHRGRRCYNSLCRRCIHSCKQSFRVTVVECPRYFSKRAVGRDDYYVKTSRSAKAKPHRANQVLGNPGRERTDSQKDGIVRNRQYGRLSSQDGH